MATLVETLFYQVYNYVLLNKQQDAKMYLEFLRDEYQSNPKKFDILKQDNRWQQLQEFSHSLENNLYLSSFETVKNTDFVDIKCKQTVDNQRILTNKLIKSKDSLRQLLNAESDFECIATEAETIYGNVDLLAQDKNTIYPIEIKKERAEHDVLGQIDKYIIHYKLKLINKIYNKVQGVVISSGFSNFVLQELSKQGIVAIFYNLNKDGIIELKKI
jgi:RecB family endonuclease NucS